MRTTKKDLEAQLQREQDRLDEMYNEKQELERKLALQEKYGIHVWEANIDGDSRVPCVCIGGLPEPFGLNLYTTTDDKVVGFLITYDTKTVAAGGLIPGAKVMDEIEYTRAYG